MKLRAGLSAEVCFAKYIAFKNKCFYRGYEKSTPGYEVNFVDKMLLYIYLQVTKHKDNGKTVLYSPGICNVPYLV